jgi:hypothetical protein
VSTAGESKARAVGFEKYSLLDASAYHDGLRLKVFGMTRLSYVSMDSQWQFLLTGQL